MDTHVCKQCGSSFVYCRACVFRPIKYKDFGYCSKECYEASKVKVEPVVDEVVETISIEDIIPIEEVPADVIADAVAEVDAPVEVKEIVTTEKPIEATKKKETNTYKNKKNKYKYTSSY